MLDLLNNYIPLVFARCPFNLCVQLSVTFVFVVVAALRQQCGSSSSLPTLMIIIIADVTLLSLLSVLMLFVHMYVCMAASCSNDLYCVAFIVTVSVVRRHFL